MFTPPKQPSIETRFQIGILGYLIPIGLLMFCHMFNIQIVDDLKQFILFISYAFMGIATMETFVALWNIFFVQKLIPYQPAVIEVTETKTAPSFNPNKSQTVKDYSNSRAGYVYLLAAIHDPTLFKIGRTNNPDNRLKTFNVKLPFPVEYICTIKTDDMYLLERQLHGQYAAQRLDGEFFRLTESDVTYIKSLAK